MENGSTTISKSLKQLISACELSQAFGQPLDASLVKELAEHIQTTYEDIANNDVIYHATESEDRQKRPHIESTLWVDAETIEQIETILSFKETSVELAHRQELIKALYKAYKYEKEI